jgi:hypothetical protein
MSYCCGVRTSMDRRRALLGALSLAAATSMAGLQGCEREPAPDRITPTIDPPSRLYPASTAELFRPGTRHTTDTGDVGVAEVVPAGVLRLPTGRLVAADPGWLPSWRQDHIAPFTATVPPGTYPLTLALLRFPQDLRVAAARVTIIDEPVTAWDMALRAGQDPATLRAGHFFDVGVDDATMVLFDAVALAAMGRLASADPTAFDIQRADRPVERAEVIPGSNAIAFSTGWGDGGYPVWIGRINSGAVSCFIVDMLMLAPPAATGATPWTPPTRATHTPDPSGTTATGLPR